MRRRIIAFLILTGFASPVLASDNPDATWISSLKCSDLISVDGTINRQNLARFNTWLVGLMMGASAAGPVNIVKAVSVNQLGEGVLDECQGHQTLSAVSAAIDGLEFFTNTISPGEIHELKDPGLPH